MISAEAQLKNLFNSIGRLDKEIEESTRRHNRLVDDLAECKRNAVSLVMQLNFSINRKGLIHVDGRYYSIWAKDGTMYMERLGSDLLDSSAKARPEGLRND